MNHSTQPVADRPRRLRVFAWLAAVQLVAPVALAQSDPDPAPAASTPAAASEPELSEVSVYLKSGQRISGLLLDSNRSELVLRIAGIPTHLPMSEIERYDVLPPVLQRYQKLRESIGNDPDQIVHLAEWLQAREQHALALTEILRALEVNPDHGGARRLRAVLEQQILLRNKAGTPTEPSGHGETATPSRPKPGEFPLLAPDQINLIKVYELNLQDKPRVSISRETVLRMLEANAGHPLVPVTREGREAILRKSANEILDLMFRLQAREFYPQVEVIDQPRPFKLFRDDIQRTWLMSCASNSCHGGLEAGRLVLHNKSPNSEASVYTNFLILNRFVTSSGQSLINWDNPDRSPLLQYGLPRADSLFPHPVAPRGASGADAWKPEFRSVDDKMFVRAVEWIRMMYRPRPTYPLDYAPLRPFEPAKNTPSTGGSAGGGSEPVHR